MHCPTCGSTVISAISVHTLYIDEPITFSSANFDHIHDLNPRVAIWNCNNSHEFQTKGTYPCISCLLEQQIHINEEQQRIRNSNRRTTSLGDDHHRDNNWVGPDFGPIS